MLGGVTKTAKLVGLTQPGVSRWLIENGTAGRVPQKYWPKILKYAEKHKIKITIKLLSGI
jgi:predicted transcriptional regulator